MELHLPEGDYEGYIFDCDGTLVDSMPLHYRAWTAAFEANQAPYVFTEKRFYDSAGRTEVDVVAELNAENDVDYVEPRAVVEYKQKWFMEHMHELKPVQAVAEIVKDLASKGVKMSVASGSEAIIVDPELEICGFSQYFDIRITPADVENGKPAPDMFLLAAEKMGVAPEMCVVFEDGQHGVDAAEAADMAVVFVPTAKERLAEIS